MATETQKREQRKYPRTHQAFLVKFQPLDENDKPWGGIFQGFTKNIAKGGMLIESRIDKKQEPLKFTPNKSKLRLLISIPPNSVPIDSTATVRWSTKVSEPAFDTCFFGVEYDQIDNAQQRMIQRYINRLRKKPRIFLYFSLLSISFIIVFTYFILVVR